MTPSELIAWHAHQITFLPETDNTMVQHHRDAMHCIERLRAELARMRDASEACTQEHDGLIAEQRTLRNAAVIATERAEKAEAELAACKEDAERWWNVCGYVAAVEAERDALRAEVNESSGDLEDRLDAAVDAARKEAK
jgi:hypothetical protein